MNRKMLVRAGMLLLAVLTAAPLFSESPNTEKRIVAEVNGVKLMEKDQMVVLGEIMPKGVFHRTIDPKKIEEKKKEALDELIIRELYYQEGKKTISVERSEVSDIFDEIKGRFKSEDQFRKALTDGGYTEKEFRDLIEKKLVREKFYDREVIQKSKVSDAFLEDYYKKNKSTFFRPEGFRIRHIVIKVPPEATKEERKEYRKKAEDVLKKAKAGEDFAQLAWDYSTDEYRVKGGDIGVMHEGMMLKELEESAVKMKPGEVSDLIETIYGYHIIKVEEKFPPTQMAFEEVRDKLRDKFEKERKNKFEEELIKRLKGSAKIIIYGAGQK